MFLRIYGKSSIHCMEHPMGNLSSDLREVRWRSCFGGSSGKWICIWIRHGLKQWMKIETCHCSWGGWQKVIFMALLITQLHTPGGPKITLAGKSRKDRDLCMDFVSWMRGKKMGKVIWTQQKELEMRCWVCTACKKTPFTITGASSRLLQNFKRRHNCDSHNAALASLNLAEWKDDKNAPSVGCIYLHFPTQKFVLNLLEMLANSTIYSTSSVWEPVFLL